MELAYRETGEGTPLIILHGLFGQSDNWNTIARRFAEKGFRVFTVDQRNHGLSPHSVTFDYVSMAADLKEFIDKHRLDKPILIGHSMGGKTVMFFEKNYPGIASRLVIVDIASKRYEPHHQEVLDALNSVDRDLITGRKDAEEILAAKISDAGTRQFLLKNLYWNENKKMDWRFNLEVISDQYINVTVEVPFFTSLVPVLVVKGDKSKYISHSDEEDFKKRFPGCRIARIPGAGHWVHAEKPDDFFEKVVEFITA